MANWYGVYTRPRCEKKVAEGFTKRKWESYCPLTKVTRSWPGLITSATALFPCYVFVRLEAAQLGEVKKVEGVINLVYWLGQPVVVRDIEVEMIKRFLSVHKQVKLEKTAVAPMAMVQLAEAPLLKPQGASGVVTPSATGAKLLLPSLGYILASATHSYIHPTFNPAQVQQQRLLQ